MQRCASDCTGHSGLAASPDRVTRLARAICSIAPWFELGDAGVSRRHRFRGYDFDEQACTMPA
jgi:hypothetical protein